MNTILCTLLALGFVAVASANVSCYQCNTDVEGQSKCDSSEATDISQYVKPCPSLNEGKFTNQAAIGCRKIIQIVGEDTSTIRECAYSGDNVENMKKTGNWGISLWYYQCTNKNDGDACNSAPAFSLFISMVCSLLVFLH